MTKSEQRGLGIELTALKRKLELLTEQMDLLLDSSSALHDRIGQVVSHMSLVTNNTADWSAENQRDVNQLREELNELRFGAGFVPAEEEISVDVDPDDPVNPQHYQDGEEECIDRIRRMLGDIRFSGFCRGNAIKYRYRAEKKGNAEVDLKKAEWYSEMAAHVEEPWAFGDPRGER